MDCTSCKEKQKQAEPIPYSAYEFGVATVERTNKRLWIVVIILILALIVSNVCWITYENQFEDVVTTEIEQDAGDGSGNNYIVGGDYHGETAGQNHENQNPENGR